MCLCVLRIAYAGVILTLDTYILWSPGRETDSMITGKGIGEVVAREPGERRVPRQCLGRAWDGLSSSARSNRSRTMPHRRQIG